MDKSAFYPLSGGQQNDVGVLTVDNVKYEVVDVQKVGRAILHFVDRPVTLDIVGKTVTGEVD